MEKCTKIANKKKHLYQFQKCGKNSLYIHIVNNHVWSAARTMGNEWKICIHNNNNNNSKTGEDNHISCTYHRFSLMTAFYVANINDSVSLIKIDIHIISETVCVLMNNLVKNCIFNEVIKKCGQKGKRPLTPLIQPSATILSTYAHKQI